MHLYIEQNTGLVEQVNSNIITRLYQIAQAGLDQTSDLKGTLHSSVGYKKYSDWLNEHYDDLTITIDTPYIWFACPTIEQYWATSHGDGNGITYNAAQTVQNFPQRDSEYNEVISSSNKINGNYAFFRDTTITTFNELKDFPNITTIPENCFRQSSLTSIDLSNITTIYPGAFRQSSLSGVINIPNLINLPNRTTNTDYNSDGECFGYTNITEAHIGSNVPSESKLKQIKAYLFRGCSSLTKVTGFSEATSVEKGSFLDTVNLTQVDTTNKLTIIEEQAFYNSGISCIDLSNVTKIGQNAFRKCPLQSISTSNPEEINPSNNSLLISATTIGSQAFAEWDMQSKDITLSGLTGVIKGSMFRSSKVNSINIPGGTSLESDVFRQATVNKINLGEVTIIGQEAFRECKAPRVYFGGTSSYNTSTGEIDYINTSLSGVGNMAFLTASSLFYEDEIEISGTIETKPLNMTFQGLTSISSGCFQGSKIRKINLPNVTILQGNSFFNCTSLLSVNIPSATTLENRSFEGCTSLSSITFSSITSIGNNCFKNCTSLTSIVFPEGLTTLGQYSFLSTGLSGIVELPSTITSIGGGCFNDSNNITGFIIRAVTPPTLESNRSLGTLTVSNILAKKIYVPDNSAEDYRTAFGAISSTYAEAITPLSQYSAS